jgi:hypothetical protein
MIHKHTAVIYGLQFHRSQQMLAENHGQRAGTESNNIGRKKETQESVEVGGGRKMNYRLSDG